MVDVLGSLGADLDKVVITDVSEGTFFAELHLKSRQGPLTVSARPSDAIAVAVRAGCGIYVDESVMDTAGRIAQFDDDDSDQAPGEVDELVDEFRDFIDSIKPEDFAP